jgi:DNA-binding transcriptional MerR regulator
MSRPGLLIGEVAARTGLTRRALRRYEAAGLLPPPPRTAAGYRLYPVGVLEAVAFVRAARRLGLGLAEIRELLAVHRSGRRPCARVRRLVDARLAELDALARRLRRVRARLAEAGRGGRGGICPPLEAEGDAPWPTSESRSARPAGPAPRSSSPTITSGSAKPETRSFSAGRHGTPWWA